MTDSEKLDSIAADVAYLVRFVEGLRMGGPRILPGDGSKPPDKPPEQPPAAQSNIDPMTLSMLTAGHENSGQQPAPNSQAVPLIDRRTLRDLSDILGPAIVEGPAGTQVIIECRRPVGSRVEINLGRTTSALGACTSVDAFVAGTKIEGRGSDATGSGVFTSSGNDPIRVVLNESGAAEVHRA